jgi:predicted MFS family arabinose efflux permease
MFSWGSLPLGSVIAGILAQWFGMRVAFLIFTLAAAAIIVPFFRNLPAQALADRNLSR